MPAAMGSTPRALRTPRACTAARMTPSLVRTSTSTRAAPRDCGRYTSCSVVESPGRSVSRLKPGACTSGDESATPSTSTSRVPPLCTSRSSTTASHSGLSPRSTTLGSTDTPLTVAASLGVSATSPSPPTSAAMAPPMWPQARTVTVAAAVSAARFGCGSCTRAASGLGIGLGPGLPGPRFRARPGPNRGHGARVSSAAPSARRQSAMATPGRPRAARIGGAAPPPPQRPDPGIV
mmetsp:Transcript_12390/g.37194  ORF Transcript_12390/g.37194 Transcript_12390/m.37194 type:complete len:235 (+) Transcript_12390:180-884(+)